MKNRIRVLLASLFLLLGLSVPALPAQAVQAGTIYNGNICVTPYSPGYVIVAVNGSTKLWYVHVRGGYCASYYMTGQIIYFELPYYYYCKSQWGYIYKWGHTYNWTGSGVLTLACWYSYP